MTCHDAREQFSALVDGALAPGERAAVEAHLATCADCRRELQRFRDTVALVRAVGPLRAPAGFVDRVLEAARPVPWHRRVVRSLFLPWPIKLPIEAAAVVLVGIGAALVYRATPVQRFSPVESLAPPMRDRFEGVVPPGSAPGPAREPELARENSARRALPADTREADTRERDRAKDQVQALAKAREAKQAAEPPKAPAQAPPAVPAPPAGAVQQSAPGSRDLDAQKTQEREKLEAQLADKGDAPRAEVERAPSAGTPYLEPAPPPKPESTPAAPRSQVDAAAAKRAAPSITGSAFAPPAVSGRLTVTDREAALRSVDELATRLGAQTHRMDSAAGQDQLVELMMPREVYPEFIRELARLGRWQPINEPAELPARVRVVLQIAR